MDRVKVTQALCEWIESAGGEVDPSDEESVVNALKKLYVTYGGEIPENVPDDVATWIQGVAYAVGNGGGGGGQYTGKLFKVKARTEQVLSSNTAAPFYGIREAGDDTSYPKWIQFVSVNSSNLGSNAYGVGDSHAIATAKALLSQDGTLAANASGLRVRIIYEDMDDVSRNAFDQVFEEVTE